MKIRVLDTELKVGNIRRKINSVNILSFKYSFFCEGADITCQVFDENNCICFEEIIFIKKEILKHLGSDDNKVISELLIRLGLKEYNTNEQGNKKIKK